MTEQEQTGGGLTKDLPTDRLVHEAQNLMSALGERALGQVSGKLSDATERLTDYAENGGSKAGALLTAGRSLASGKSGLRSMFDAGVEQTKEKVKGAFGGGSGKDGGGGDKGKKIKVTNIVESIEVGVPVSVAYNQWTQFEDFPTFMKKVENIKQESETELEWKAQVFWSHRNWKSTVIEQMPDERIVWESTGEKGRVDGAVTFHELTPDLTKILVVLEYHPQGFMEHTGNLWRAQGRRARLELKHFQRHVMTHTILDQDEVEGWRGEVADGEVVRSDEEVREEEENEQAEDAAEGGGDEDAEASADDEGEDSYDEETEEDEDAEDTEDEDEDQDDGDEGADEEEEEAEDDDEDADETEEEPDEDEKPEPRTRPKSRAGRR